MTDTITVAKKTPCPICLRVPHAWRERAQYGSRELFWVGCRVDSKLVGAITQGVALQLWERLAARLRYELANK